MPAEVERFTIDYPERAVEEVWQAVKRAVATMDRRSFDETTHMVRFGTGVSLTSWGQHMLATVAERPAGGARVTVRGRAKGSFLTSEWGERIHANGVEKDLRTSVDDALVQTL